MILICELFLLIYEVKDLKDWLIFSVLCDNKLNIFGVFHCFSEKTSYLKILTCSQKLTNLILN